MQSTSNSQSQDACFHLAVASDRMSVSVVGYTAPTGEGAPPDLGLLTAQLKNAGISVEADERSLKKVMNYIRIGRPLQGGIEVARGKSPVHGENGRVELAVQTALSTGAVHEDGRIDYHDRGLIQSVTAGERLGRLVAPTSGTPGEDVYGHPVPPKPGQPASFISGENVRVAENGVDIFSDASGMVRWDGRTLSVVETLEISGDVDFATGDLMMKEGSVRIHGTVRSGFKVHAVGDATVEQSIEDAELVVGGNATVQGGVLKGRLRCSGSIWVKYAENATLEADGDVTIQNSAFNCTVSAGGRVVVLGGKGLIRGGTVCAAGGVEADEIGSNAIAGTAIVVGKGSEIYTALLEEKEALEKELFQFTHKHGELSLEGISTKFGDASNPMVDKALKNMARLNCVIQSMEAEKQRMRRAASAELRVRKIIHQGTMLTMFGKTITLHHPVMISCFFFNRETEEILWRPL